MRTLILLLALLAGTGAYAATLPLYVDAIINGESVQCPNAEHFELDYKTGSPRFIWFCVTTQTAHACKPTTPYGPLKFTFWPDVGYAAVTCNAVPIDGGGGSVPRPNRIFLGGFESP